MIKTIETTFELLNKRLAEFGYNNDVVSLDTTITWLQEHNFDSIDLLEISFDLEKELNCCISISNIGYTGATTLCELVHLITCYIVTNQE